MLTILFALLVALGLALPARAGAVSIAPSRNVSTALFAELEELSRLVGIAYCVGNQGISRPFDCLNRCNDFKGFELVETWDLGLLDPSSCGYIALSHPPYPKRIIVAFRGSNSFSDVIYDLMTQPAEYLPYPLNNDTMGHGCEECKVHAGFLSLWSSTRDLILPVLEKAIDDHPDYRLVLTGHSLGGAVAGLAALEFASRAWKPSVTTFGEPRFGNPQLAEFVDKIFPGTANETAMAYRRVTHVGDPVPLLPPADWDWAMHGGEIYISKPALPPTIADLRHCEGAHDPDCIAGSKGTVNQEGQMLNHVADSVSQIEGDGLGVIPGFPAEWKLWEILFSHREYFWRLGLCWDPQQRDYPTPPLKDLQSDEL